MSPWMYGSLAYVPNSLNKILCVLKESEPYAGLWSFPGGKTLSPKKLSERDSKTIVVKDFNTDTDLDLKIMRNVGTLKFPDNREGYKDLLYECDVWFGRPRLYKDLKPEKAKWIDRNQFTPSNMAYPVVEYLKKIDKEKVSDNIILDLTI